MGFFSSIGKIAKGAVKGVGAGVKVVGSAASVIKNVPVLGSAVMLVPGAAQLSAGISVANGLVKAVAGGGPKAAQAKQIINNTKMLAAKGKTPQIRTAARNALTVVKKQAAARQTVQKHRVLPTGMVVKVA